MSVGGSIESVTLNGRSFAVAADADSNRFLGGFVNDVQANGNGSGRFQVVVGIIGVRRMVILVAVI